MTRPHFLFFGLVSYLMSIAPMVYLAGFLANLELPTQVDGAARSTAGVALAIDLTLLISFGLVHSLLAREWVKAGIRGLVPAELERSLYSAVAGLQVTLLLVYWQPLPAPVWALDTPSLRALVWALYGAGWAIVISALLAVDSSHLFGLRQAAAGARRREYREPVVVARGPYRWVRHPLYLGTILSLFAAPTMSTGHLLLALVLTSYILIGLRFEERDLERRHGAAWLEYKARIPALLPRIGSSST